MPRLQVLYDRYKDQGFTMVAINVVPEQNELIPDFRRKHGLTFPILVDEPTGWAKNHYSITSTPESFLLDSRAMIHLRTIDDEVREEDRIEEVIRRLLDLD